MIEAEARLAETRLLAAEAIAREAGALARARFADRSFSVGFKGPQDYLTEVDRETEELIASRLAAAFPSDGFLGEETNGREAGEGAAVWVVDPIDGTANFARGNPYFCRLDRLRRGGPDRDGRGLRPDAGGTVLGPARARGAAQRRDDQGRADRPRSRARLIEIGWNMRSGREDYAELIRRIVADGRGAFPLRLGRARARLCRGRAA